MNEVLTALLRAASFGTPLLLASLGAIVCERSGVVNLGLEGMMALGALAGFAVAYSGGGLWLAVLAAAGAGIAASLLHALVTLTFRANQFVSGLALTMLGLGVAGLLGKPFEGFPLFDTALEWPFTVGALLLAGVLYIAFYFSRLGLVLRSVGENPAAADVLGLNVTLVRVLAIAFGGALAGIAGSFLSLAYRPSWTDGMTVGLGWVAVALVIFVGWNPLRAVFGSLFFGVLYYLQFRLQGNVPIPTEVFAAMPYFLVIVVLALIGARGQGGDAPEALGRAWRRGER
jgi:simple sugar transport system permease protein